MTSLRSRVQDSLQANTTYYQRNREIIRKQQNIYFKKYYQQNKLELDARSRIRSRALYYKNKLYTDELKALMSIPTANDFIQLENALKIAKEKKDLKDSRSDCLKTKKPRKKKVKEEPPRYSYAKGNFVLSFN